MNPVRAAAQARLEQMKGAFLRCDRGTALYVTNAPVRSEQEIDWAEAGFNARTEGKLTFLTPGLCWLEPFGRWVQAKAGEPHLSSAVSNACFGDAEEADVRLWIEGIKRMELKNPAQEYEKMVRQRAAVCLREKRGGATLPVCGLIVDFLNEGGEANED